VCIIFLLQFQYLSSAPSLVCCGFLFVVILFVYECLAVDATVLCGSGDGGRWHQSQQPVLGTPCAGNSVRTVILACILTMSFAL